MTVVDASVAVKWFIPEVGQAEANHLIETKDQLVAPALIRVEVAAAIVRRLIRGEISFSDGNIMLELWRRYISDGIVTLVRDEAHLSTACSIARELAHPLQDCLYLAVAKFFNSDLVTADQKFVEKTRDHKQNEDLRIKLLGQK